LFTPIAHFDRFLLRNKQKRLLINDQLNNPNMRSTLTSLNRLDEQRSVDVCFGRYGCHLDAANKRSGTRLSGQVVRVITSNN
jgi:hypothetical protein